MAQPTYGVTNKKIAREKGIHQKSHLGKVFGEAAPEEQTSKKAVVKKKKGKPTSDRKRKFRLKRKCPSLVSKDTSTESESAEKSSKVTLSKNIDLANRENVETSRDEGGKEESTTALAKADGEVHGELNKNGDSRGMHLTSSAAKELRKKRGFYGKHVPPLQCNNCAYTATCPMFKASYECAFEKALNHKIRSAADLNAAMVALVESDLRRVQLGVIQETLSGGQIDGRVSDRVDAAFSKLEALKRSNASSGSGDEDDLHVKGSLVKDLLSAALGGAKKESPPEESKLEVIDAEPVNEVIDNPTA